MSETAVKGQRDIYTNQSQVNQLDFMIQMAMSEIQTCIPCKVVDVHVASGSTGYVDVLPLVAHVDGMGKAVQPVTHYNVPYSRIQGGIAALIIDPVVGDIGLVCFAGKDTSNVKAGTTEPQQPASFRRFSPSDGFYIGGFLNQAPQVYVELTQEKVCNIIATGGVNIVGNVTVQGSITATDDIVADGYSLINHWHIGNLGSPTSFSKK